MSHPCSFLPRKGTVLNSHNEHVDIVATVFLLLTLCGQSATLSAVLTKECSKHDTDACLPSFAAPFLKMGLKSVF